MLTKLTFGSLVEVVLLGACGGGDTPSKVESPGGEETATAKLLNTGAESLQAQTPLRQFSVYLDGFHFYNGNMEAQMEARHYVSQLNEDMYQAIIFDGNEEAAKIMGVEYIITGKLFDTLPD